MRTVGAAAVYWLRSRLRWGAEVSKNQDASVAKAKKAIGQPEGLAVLMVFFCECATGRDSDVGLHVARRFGQNLGYGVGDNMDDLLAKHGFDGGPR